MSSCTAGLSSSMNERGQRLLRPCPRRSRCRRRRTGVPLTRRDDDVVELIGGIDAAERAQPDLPLALLERAAGNLDVLLLNRVAHLVDRQAARVQLLDVDDDVDFARRGRRSCVTSPTPSTDSSARFTCLSAISVSARRLVVLRRDARALMIESASGSAFWMIGGENFRAARSASRQRPFRARCWRRRRGRARARTAR